MQHTIKLFDHFSYTPLPLPPKPLVIFRTPYPPPLPASPPSCVFAKPHQKKVVLTFYYRLYKLRHHSSITLQEERAAISVLVEYRSSGDMQH